MYNPIEEFFYKKEKHMRKEDGLTIIPLVIIVALLIVLAVFAVKFVFGRNGVVDQLKEADNEYNTTEIVDNLNLIVKEKYVLDSKYALEIIKQLMKYAIQIHFLIIF